MANFDFAARKLVLEQERQERQQEAKRIKEAQEHAVSDLLAAITAYLRSINRNSNVLTRSDTGFQLLTGQVSLVFSVSDDLTFKYKADADTYDGPKHKGDSGLSAEEVTDSILIFFHPELER